MMLTQYVVSSDNKSVDLTKNPPSTNWLLSFLLLVRIANLGLGARADYYGPWVVPTGDVYGFARLMTALINHLPMNETNDLPFWSS
jgi:hypothetical protein